MTVYLNNAVVGTDLDSNHLVIVEIVVPNVCVVGAFPHCNSTMVIQDGIVLELGEL